MSKIAKENWVNIYKSIYSFKKQELSKIHMPALIILGQHESPSIFKHAQLMKREIASSKIEIIKDAGHVPNIDQPEAFNEVVHQFLQNIGASGVL